MATQSDALVTQEASLTPDPPLIAGRFPRAEREVVIASGQAALTRGTPLGVVTASGLYAHFDPDATDGSEDPTLIVILAIDTVAATTGDVKAYAYATGEFNGSLVLDINDAALDATAIAALEARNIYLKEVA